MKPQTSTVRTRFAPSPTGYMHVGNLRTALYAYLCARSMGGQYILRIEDTDQKRYVEDAVEVIYRTLKGAGIDWDEGPDVGGAYGPYVQSDRKEIYQKYAHELVTLGGAYYCFCDKIDLTPEKTYNEWVDPCRDLDEETLRQYLREGRPYVIRQKIPKDGITAYDDLVYGHIAIENQFLDDQVLLKRDGMPTYNFANVVDDHLMGITHVVRGADFLSSTPKYQLLYKAFGWESPIYAHLPLIMGQNPDGTCSKLSKRHGATSFEQLTEEGYLPEAIVNYIALLGWSPKSDSEILTMDEMIRLFNLKEVNHSQAIFDFQKLTWLNGEIIAGMSDEDFATAAAPFITACSEKTRRHWSFIAPFLKTRIKTLKECETQVAFIDECPEYAVDLFKNKRNKVTSALAESIIRETVDWVSACSESDWVLETLTEKIETFCLDHQLKKGAVMWPLRIALAGQPVTPMGTPEILFVLGKATTLERLAAALEKLQLTENK